MFAIYFTELLEYMTLSVTYYVWGCVPWYVKLFIWLVLIFATWWLCKTVYWFCKLLIENVGEFRRDVQWTAAQVRRAAVWMKRTVDDSVGRRMMQERPNRFNSPPPARGVTIIRSRSRPRIRQATPRRVRFGASN